MAGTICSAFARMWAGNVTHGADPGVHYPSRLMWSGAVGTTIEGGAVPAGPWNWPDSNWLEVNPEDGGTITKIIQYGQSILIFKEQSIHVLVGAGDPTTATLYTVDSNVGCTSPAR